MDVEVLEVLLGGREGAPPLRVVEAQPVALGHFAVCWGDVVEERLLATRAGVEDLLHFSLFVSREHVVFAVSGYT